MLKALYRETKQKNLCMAGGVALNSLANGKILGLTPFDDVFIPASPTDAGGSMGVALYAYNTILGNKRSYVMDTAALGPEYSTKEVREFLDANGIKYSSFSSPEEIVTKTADLILDNKVVGWFQGRMEWGPRALGNRSILANPLSPNMKSILNEKVKHRETFRPFAPAVPAEDARKFFEFGKLPLAADFMLMVYPVKKKYRKIAPAITHVDGTGRLQTVRKGSLYYLLLKEMGRRTGVPMLVNTSFNIRGEPIVCTPKEAYRCMMGTGIDFLVMNKFLIARNDNGKDMWDSEKTIND
jgi:carbamoyltransferase